MTASPAWRNRIERVRAMLILGLPVTALILRDSPGFFFCLKLALLLSLIGMVLDPDREDWNGRVDFLILAPLAWALMLGVRNANPGVWKEFPLFALAPVTYLLLFRRIPERFSENLLTICNLAALFHLAVFFFLFSFPGDSDIYRHFQSATGFVVQPHDGFTKVYANQASQLAFILPVLLMCHFRECSISTALLSAGCLLMSLILARKAIILLAFGLVLAQLLWALYRRFSAKQILVLCAPSLVALALYPVISQVDPARYLHSFGESWPTASVYAMPENKCQNDNGIDSPGKAGAVVRGNQIATLTREIARAPLFGHGAGYVVADCIRSDEQPWRFEMVYLGLAMNMGLAGLLILLVLYAVWVKRCLNLYKQKEAQSEYFADLIIGSFLFLVCSASNPYVMAIENLWIFFLPYLLSRLRSCNRSRIGNAE